MDRYMNETHSLYYNVDQSSMFGSNLSTVFADGPPPLEDGEDDHGEFVFSSETDAIGEAVLNKIESKLQRDAEAKLDCSTSSSRLEMKPNSTENFEPFAGFETASQIDTSSGNDEVETSNHEVNGYKDNLTNNASSDFTDGNFRDFSTGSCQHFNENGNSADEIHNCDFGSFSQFNDINKSNVKSMSAYNKQVVLNESNAKTESNLGDMQFGSFPSFESVNSKLNDTGLQSNDNSLKQPVGNKFAKEKIQCQTDNNHTSEDEFLSFTEGNKTDFAAFQAEKLNAGDNPTHPDIVPADDINDLRSGKLQPDVMNHEEWKFKDLRLDNEKNRLSDGQRFKDDNDTFPHDLSNETQHHCNKLKSIGHSEGDATINAKKNLKSTNSPPDLINKATTSSDPGTSITLNESFPDKKKGEVLRTGVSSCYTNLKSKADNNTDSMPIDNDFGDFVDFSSKSVDAFSSEFGISSEKDEDSTLGSYSKEKERIFYQSGESEFDAFTESVSTETKDLTRNDMKWPKPDFKECSESAGSENEPAFQADFGAFSESAFSESTDSKNKQSDFGAFSESTYSKNNQSAFIAVSQSALFQKSTKQLAMQTQLVSFDACFEGVFPALEIALEDLEHVKTGMKSLNQDNLWNSLYSNMGEAAIRFNWEKCKTSEKICKALKVSWKNIVANPNILAMSEGLDVPVFATGLGILQPSIVPAPPKKRKTKCKQKQDVSIKQEGSGTSLPVSSLAQQTAFPDFKTESIKDNNSDTGSLSNSDTASLDLDFFASTPSNLVTNLGDQNLSSNLYNLDFTFGPAVPQIQACGTNTQAEMNVFKPSKSLQDDPLVILKKLDNSKMSSFGNGSGTRLSPRAKQIIETFEDLSFMHSSVLMFPLQNDN